MRTNQHALTTFDTQVGFPHRNILRDIALLPTCGSYRISTIFRKRTDWQQISATRDHFGSHTTNKLGRIERYFRCQFNRAARVCRNHDLAKVSESCVDRCEVLANDWLTAFSVTLAYELLDLGYCFIARQHATECEETRLHDRIDPVAKLTLSRHAGSVDRINLESLLDNHFLDGLRQMIPDLGFFVRAVDQQSRTFNSGIEHVVLAEERKLMYGYEICPLN